MNINENSHCSESIAQIRDIVDSSFDNSYPCINSSIPPCQLSIQGLHHFRNEVLFLGIKNDMNL